MTHGVGSLVCRRGFVAVTNASRSSSISFLRRFLAVSHIAPDRQGSVGAAWVVSASLFRPLAL